MDIYFEEHEEFSPQLVVFTNCPAPVGLVNNTRKCGKWKLLWKKIRLKNFAGNLK